MSLGGGAGKVDRPGLVILGKLSPSALICFNSWRSLFSGLHVLSGFGAFFLSHFFKSSPYYIFFSIAFRERGKVKGREREASIN